MSKTNFRLDVMPFVIATGGEFLALHYWLVFQDMGFFILANLVRWAGFLTERIAVVTWIQRIYRPTVGVASQNTLVATKAVRLFVVMLTEILIWIVWLWLADEVDFWLTVAVLMMLMLAEHSMEMVLMKKDRFWKYVGNAKTIYFTVMEVAGGMAWLYLVRHDAPVWGALAPIVGLGIEHVLQGRQLKPDPSKMVTAPA